MDFPQLFSAFYVATVFGLSVHGFVFLLFAFLFLSTRHPAHGSPALDEWPSVTVQLPVFNERLVVERLIDAVAALDYPRDKLSIQVLDDSTDETTALACSRAAYYRARGLQVQHLHRSRPRGHKAGALAEGFETAPGEYLALFDADFLPPRDFLRRTMPYFADPAVGMVQARWGHLNDDYNVLTQAQSIALDGYQIVEHSVRSRLGLMLNFNGSAGIWRRECIAQAGGWQADTLAEDLDLSFRAQLTGWRLLYLPHIVVPCEIPPRILALKRQLFRWTKGTAQVFWKLGWRLLTSRETPARKLYGLIHMGQSFSPLLMITLVLTTLPMILWGGLEGLRLDIFGLAALGAPVMFSLSQWATYRDWPRRLAYFPLLVLLAMGMSLSNSWATLEALLGRNPTLFLRTPKYRIHGQNLTLAAPEYALSLDWTVWGEIVLALYCAATTVAAIRFVPGLALIPAIYAAGFAYTAVLGLQDGLRPANVEWRMQNAD